MTDIVQVAVIAAAPLLIGQLVAGYVAYRSGKRVEAAVTEVHVQINSRMDDWIKAATQTARQEGHDAGTLAERDRHSPKE